MAMTLVHITRQRNWHFKEIVIKHIKNLMIIMMNSKLNYEMKFRQICNERDDDDDSNKQKIWNDFN